MGHNVYSVHEICYISYAYVVALFVRLVSARTWLPRTFSSIFHIKRWQARGKQEERRFERGKAWRRFAKLRTLENAFFVAKPLDLLTVKN